MPVVLFDGKCNLCNGAVQFILDHETDHVLTFASLQSVEGRAVLEEAAGSEQTRAITGGPDGDPTTIVLVEDGRAYTHSSAALRIARHLRLPWRAIRIGLLVPRFIRDAVYRLIARNRYRWFGKTETCRVPTSELRARFVR